MDGGSQDPSVHEHEETMEEVQTVSDSTTDEKEKVKEKKV